MKNLLCVLLMGCLVLVPACGLDVKLELGTMGVTTRLDVDEWAQANVLKALDELIASDNAPDDPVPETIEEVTP